ncbi:MAG: hypothetical protein FWC41_03225 [Firmicutes bacterium]|nr:hypothetical protein [Bacillota bacterium]
MKTFELSPTNGRKSFYGKAFVITNEDGSQVLVSYGTQVLRINPDGTKVRLWGGWSATTGTHIASFCGLNKKEFQALDLVA